MPAGGYQQPRKPAAVSGPGSSSRRTDGRLQTIREPDIDNPGLQYGDRKNLSEAQRIAGIGNRPSQTSGPTRRSTGSPAIGGKTLPPWLTAGESAFPAEPGTAGLDMGPGPGAEALMAGVPAPDEREDILQAMVAKYNSPQAKALLQKIRQERHELAQSDAAAPAAGTLNDPLAEPTAAPEPEPSLPPEEEGPPLPESDVPTLS